MRSEFAPYIGPAVLFVLLGWRMMRATRGRPLNPDRLWIRPALLFLFLVLAFLHPPAITFLSLGAFVLALAAGIGTGYVRAAHQTLTIDRESGTITSKMSAIGSLLFVAVFGVRYLIRIAMNGGQAPQDFTPHSGPALIVADALLIFLVAMVAAMAWQTWRRARQLLDSQAGEAPPKAAELIKKEAKSGE